ncbi:crotonase [Dietzia sp. SLG310A2-38A2]|uniref:enoyl-CoA hydratase-related protein n=1 Tax=Dietzia sp. SLG310A2-38A2 TaxID=1630643 RepID=UPI0015FE4B55|nr:enoyl-CoA hydratase-related protein [Dietzia sp. SLG310A2-38A2]MBB1029724.1 crotonase [Dietzia sp. SLG310A2-38A2]
MPETGKSASPHPRHLVVSRPEPGIVVVELARGKVNAIDRDMYGEIADTFEALSDDASARVVILTGRGRIFCAGNDLKAFEAMDAASGDTEMRAARRALLGVRECAIPVIAAINGPALGSGFGMAALCDLVVASERASFGLPEMNVGVLGGGKFTARMLPEQAMRRMFFTAEPVDADTFRRWGAPVEVVAHDALLETALAQARVIAAKSRHALVLAKQSLNGCENLDLRTGYELEQSFTVRLSEHPDSKAALASRMAELSGENR